MVTGFYLLDRPNPYYRQYRASRRNGAAISGVLVIHTAENAPDYIPPDGGAEGVASWITRRTDPGSYHRLVDSDSTILMAPLEAETWHETTLNNHAIGYSFATRANQWPVKPAWWRYQAVERMAQVCAADARYLRDRYGIRVPARLLTRAEAVARVPGFIGHGMVDVGRRTDPGPAFPWGHFLGRFAALMETPTPTPTPAPAPPTPKVRPMRLLKSPDSPRVYLTDGMTRRHVTNPAELGEVQAILRSVDVRDDVGEISAATLAAIPLAGAAPVVDAGEIRAAVTAALAGVTVDVDEDAIVAGIASRLPTRVTLAGALEAGA